MNPKFRILSQLLREKSITGADLELLIRLPDLWKIVDELGRDQAIIVYTSGAVWPTTPNEWQKANIRLTQRGEDLKKELSKERNLLN